MNKNNMQFVLRFLLFVFFCTFFTAAKAGLVQGIYLTQGTLENTNYLEYLIDNAKAVGINTFIVDLEKPSQRYKANIALLKKNDINYVARVVVFPDGGRPEQIASPAYWAKRYELIKIAMAYGAQQIQLDYIRYNTKQHASSENAKNIIKVIQWYKSRLEANHIPLQADVFGIASFGESKNIGQNIQMIAQTVDAICPMVYPSHFDPYLEHALTPYQTIYGSLRAIQGQFNDKMPVKLYAYIEVSNYRYPLHGDKRSKYIAAEIKAVKDANADGWYAWSAHNQYDYLFHLLAAYQKHVPGNILQTVEDSHIPVNEKVRKTHMEVASDDTDEEDNTPINEIAEAKKADIAQQTNFARISTPNLMMLALETESDSALVSLPNDDALTQFPPLPWPLGASHYVY